MASRMDKYFDKTETETAPKRASRNKTLYQKIDSNYEYSNVEGVAEIDETNEIDLSKIRKLLKLEQTEEEKIEHHYEEELSPAPEVEKKYNLNDILSDAKTSRVEDDKHRSLSDTHFDLLKSLEMKRLEEKTEENLLKADDKMESLEELIHTITNSKDLEGMDTKELGLDMFGDLKETGSTETLNNDSIKSIIESAKKETSEDAKAPNDGALDKSFYTSSFNFKENDFEDFKDLNKAINKNSLLIKISVYVLLAVVAAFAGFLIFNFIK